MVDDDEPKSVEEVLALLRERPEDAALYQRLGDLYFERGDLKEAGDALRQSIRLNPDDVWALLKYGNILTLCDDKNYAREMFELAAGLEPGLAAPQWCLGNLYRGHGEYELAGRAYERAVEVDPQDAQAREKLAEWRKFISGVREGSGGEGEE